MINWIQKVLRSLRTEAKRVRTGWGGGWGGRAQTNMIIQGEIKFLHVPEMKRILWVRKRA